MGQDHEFYIYEAHRSIPPQNRAATISGSGETMDPSGCVTAQRFQCSPFSFSRQLKTDNPTVSVISEGVHLEYL